MQGVDSPTSVSEVVLAWVVGALEKAGRPVGVELAAVGGITVDDCCVGLLAVAPERIYQVTDPFPLELGVGVGVAGARPCEEAPIGVDMVVSLYRCTPVIDEQGRAPSTAAQAQAFAGLTGDAAVIWNALTDVGLLGSDGYGDTLWQAARFSQVFVGDAGGCVGVETRLTLGVGQAGWCLDGS